MLEWWTKDKRDKIPGKGVYIDRETISVENLIRKKVRGNETIKMAKVIRKSSIRFYYYT